MLAWTGVGDAPLVLEQKDDINTQFYMQLLLSCFFFSPFERKMQNIVDYVDVSMRLVPPESLSPKVRLRQRIEQVHKTAGLSEVRSNAEHIPGNRGAALQPPHPKIRLRRRTIPDAARKHQYARAYI